MSANPRLTFGSALEMAHQQFAATGSPIGKGTVLVTAQYAMPLNGELPTVIQYMPRGHAIDLAPASTEYRRRYGERHQEDRSGAPGRFEEAPGREHSPRSSTLITSEVRRPLASPVHLVGYGRRSAGAGLDQRRQDCGQRQRLFLFFAQRFF